jgi:hypothetical protein
VTANLSKSRVLLPVFHEHVQEQGRGPGEENRAEPPACKRVEVLVEAFALAQLDDGFSQTLCVILVTILLPARASRTSLC